MTKGKLITLSGISGTGKAHLKSYLINNLKNTKPVITVTTRKQRPEEIRDTDKEFLTKGEFHNELLKGELSVVNDVFNDWYAYRTSQLESRENGENLVVELFYEDVEEVKEEFDDVLSVYVLPQNVEKIKNELSTRIQDPEALRLRLEEIDEEIQFYNQNKNLFDIIIKNDYTNETYKLLKNKIEEKIKGKSFDDEER